MATTPSEQEVLDGIRHELAEIKVPGAESATPQSTWADLDVDSLDLVELVKALEDRYGIAVPDEELKTIETVGDAVKLVQRIAAEGAPA